MCRSIARVRANATASSLDRVFRQSLSAPDGWYGTESQLRFNRFAGPAFPVFRIVSAVLVEKFLNVLAVESQNMDDFVQQSVGCNAVSFKVDNPIGTPWRYSRIRERQRVVRV